MKTRKRGVVVRVLVGGLSACAIVGCASYYRVTDPQSGRTYHTRSVERNRRGGFVELKDAKTGETVTLQSSEVAKISKYEFDRDTH